MLGIGRSSNELTAYVHISPVNYSTSTRVGDDTSDDDDDDDDRDSDHEGIGFHSQAYLTGFYCLRRAGFIVIRSL